MVCLLIIKLKGKQVVRISSQENFTEPGFSLVNANGMEDSLIVERIVPQDYDSLGFKHIQYMFADSNISESITRRTIKQYDDFSFKVNSNHLTLSKDKGVGLNWSEENRLIFGTANFL